jgi:hypothetical protein
MKGMRSQQLSGITEETQEEPQSRRTASGLRFGPAIFQTRVTNTHTHYRDTTCPVSLSLSLSVCATTRSRVLLATPIVAQPVSKFPDFKKF